VDDFPVDPTLRAAFARDVLPRSEVASGPFARWQLFTPVYAALRDIDTYDFREDYQVGPALEARVAAALTGLGSDRNFLTLSGSASWTTAWVGGLYRAGASYAGRLQDGDLIDQKSNLTLFAVSPVIGGTVRILGQASLDW